MPDTQKKPRRKRRWLRYSLRSLLVVLTIFCVVLGYWVNRVHRQRRAIKAIELIGNVVYDYEVSSNQVPFVTSMGGVYYHLTGRSILTDYDAEPRGPAWLRRWIGDEYFREVYAVDLTHSGLPMRPANDEVLQNIRHFRHLRRLILDDAEQISDQGLSHLRKLKQLERLYLQNTPITDRGLVHLGNLTELQYLCLEGTSISDEGLVHLGRLSELKWLNLSRTKITDKGLQNLRGLKNLKELYLDETQVTDEGIKKLESVLPNCHIYLGPAGVIG